MIFQALSLRRLLGSGKGGQKDEKRPSARHGPHFTSTSPAGPEACHGNGLREGKREKRDERGVPEVPLCATLFATKGGRLDLNFQKFQKYEWRRATMKSTRFGTFVWGVLIYNLLAVAWGVYVRASGSGDGCGTNWPLCDGGHIPLNGMQAKLVESSHRISTGLIGVLVAILLVGAFRIFPKGHLARKAAVGAMFMTLLEGGIGASLVKFKLVTDNPSTARATIMGFHVVSTFLLLGCIAVVALLASGAPTVRPKGQGPVAAMVLIGLLSTCFLGVSGAISALGHQLQPVDDVLKAAMNPAT
ncbi:hypothetical protein EON79_20445, partial [bacterium]